MNTLNQISLLTLVTLNLTACNSDPDFQIDPEFQHRLIYKDDNAISCQADSAIDLTTHGKLLVDEDIEVHCSHKGNDGISYNDSCGAETSSINVFVIHQGDLTEAEALGFTPVADLTDPNYDAYCELNVISDYTKHTLLEQLDAEKAQWTSENATDYEFIFHKTFNDCPTLAPEPQYKITVNNAQIVEVINQQTQAILPDTSEFMTIDALYDKLTLMVKLSPYDAAENAVQLNALPLFSDNGVPESYYINQGSAACDAITYSLTNFTKL